MTRWRLLLYACRVGVRNVTALGNLISWQKVDYDFNYHQMEFPCSINVLITSEGRSLLPVRTKVKLVKGQCSTLSTNRYAQPPPGKGGSGGGVTFPAPTAEPTHVTGGCLQPKSLSHWLAAAAPSEHQLRSTLQQAEECAVCYSCASV